MKLWKSALTALFILAVTVGTTMAQDAAAVLKKMADSKTLTFKPLYADLRSGESSTNSSFVEGTNNGGMGHFALTGEYAIVIRPDSVSSYLPYFNNTEYADSPSNGGDMSSIVVNETPAKFLSKSYDYEVKQRKKGNVEVTITPKDDTKIEKFVLDINPDGTGKLTITIRDLKSISFQGNLLLK